MLTLHYRLTGPDGADVVSTFGARPATFTLGDGQLADALEACLMQMSEGEQRSFALPADAVFGPHDMGKMQRVSRALLNGNGAAGAHYAPGDMLEFPTPDGRGRMIGAVREVDAAGVLMDFNHPLAGVPLTFEAQIISAMPAAEVDHE